MWHVGRADGFQCRIAQARPVAVLKHGDQQANPFIHLGQFKRALVLPELDGVFGGPVFQIDGAVFLTLAKRAKNGGHALHLKHCLFSTLFSARELFSLRFCMQGKQSHTVSSSTERDDDDDAAPTLGVGSVADVFSLALAFSVTPPRR